MRLPAYLIVNIFWAITADLASRIFNLSRIVAFLAMAASGVYVACRDHHFEHGTWLKDAFFLTVLFWNALRWIRLINL